MTDWMTDVNFCHSSQYCKVSLKLCTKNWKCKTTFGCIPKLFRNYFPPAFFPFCWQSILCNSENAGAKVTAKYEQKSKFGAFWYIIKSVFRNFKPGKWGLHVLLSRFCWSCILWRRPTLCGTVWIIKTSFESYSLSKILMFLSTHC